MFWKVEFTSKFFVLFRNGEFETYQPNLPQFSVWNQLKILTDFPALKKKKSETDFPTVEQYSIFAAPSVKVKVLSINGFVQDVSQFIPMVVADMVHGKNKAKSYPYHCNHFLMVSCSSCRRVSLSNRFILMYEALDVDVFICPIGSL